MTSLGWLSVECFVLAPNEAGLPDDPQSRALLHAYVEWAVKDVALARPLPGARPSGSFPDNWQTAKESQKNKS
jgi:hemoglobin